MQENKFAEKLKLIIENNNICRIERKDIDDYKKSGKPIVFNNYFLLIYYEYDFEFDGFEVLKICDITDVKYEDVDIYISNILKKEDIMPIGNIQSEFKMCNLKEICKYFFNKNENLIIECEKNLEFNIGKIIKIYDDHIMFLNFDCEGIWDTEPLDIYYDDITLISFRNRYLKYMSKYTHS